MSWCRECYYLPIKQCCTCDKDQRAFCVCVRDCDCIWINAPNDDSDNIKLCVSDSEPEVQNLRDDTQINYGAASSDSNSEYINTYDGKISDSLAVNILFLVL